MLNTIAGVAGLSFPAVSVAVTLKVNAVRTPAGAGTIKVVVITPPPAGVLAGTFVPTIRAPPFTV
jgi:hypothetical protein